MIKVFLTIIFASLLLWNCGGGDDNGGNGNTGGEGFTVTEYEPKPAAKTNPMKIYAHYMAWFETPETNNGQWGWHWTMANKNPNNIVNGRREIASWFYPSIGTYASGDPNVLEYHLLLMKYSGIDGVLVDWYGLTNLNDLPQINKNTEALFKAAQKAGMEFAMVYEDRYLQGDREAQILQAQRDMQHLRDNYFGKDNYVKINGKPLLLIFGPITLQQEADWTRVFSILTTKPTFLTLNGSSGYAGTNAQGEYIWVDASDIENKYAQMKNFPVYFGGAYPGFKDYYAEGGGGSHLFNIDYQNGNLYKNLLNLAKTQNADFLQLITWNDFGEGTMVEPTEEFKYDFLKSTQTFSGVNYSQAELELVRKLYDKRKQYAGDAEKQKKLDQVYYYLISLQTDKANELINSL